METDTLGYIIGKIISQITLDKPFSDYMTPEDSISFKCEIDLWYLRAFFF